MKLLIVSERPDTAHGLSKLLTAIGHEPYVAAVHSADSRAVLSSVAMLSPNVILLDAPEASAVAVMAVRALQEHFATRWIPTVLLTDAVSSTSQPWIHLQRRLDHRICMLPFHGAPNALYRLVGMLHGLSARPSELIGN
jgi:CheY-like chemotaxis protein